MPVNERQQEIDMVNDLLAKKEIVIPENWQWFDGKE